MSHDHKLVCDLSVRPCKHKEPMDEDMLSDQVYGQANQEQYARAIAYPRCTSINRRVSFAAGFRIAGFESFLSGA